MGCAGKTSDPSPAIPGWRCLRPPSRTLRAAKAVALGPSLTAVAGNAGDDCDRDKKTAHQPNQKTRKMTAIFAEARSKGIDTGRPVTEARDNPAAINPPVAHDEDFA